MNTNNLYVVTGAYGYSGKYITRRLLAAGRRVRTLTNSLHRQNPFGDRVDARPYDFENVERLAMSLDGAAALINTYWVRFDYSDFTHTQAVENTLRLFEAARLAGVRRIVHVSITNPSRDSPLAYFRGKAELEAALRGHGISYAILRPAVLFGEEDILINNIAWMLRRFPIFGVFGDGSYRLQPIFVDDLAALAVATAVSDDDVTIDAIGPETFTYRGLVELVGRAIGRKLPIVNIPASLGLSIARLVGLFVGDVVVTREEISGLMQDLLVTKSPPAGTTALSTWAVEHGEQLGRRYSSELARRRDRESSYEQLRENRG